MRLDVGVFIKFEFNLRAILNDMWNFYKGTKKHYYKIEKI